MKKHHVIISCFSLFVCFILSCSLIKADAISADKPRFVDIHNEYVLGEKIVFFVYYNNSGASSAKLKTVRLERPLIINNIEKYTIEQVPIIQVNPNLYQGSINTNLEKYSQGEYKLSFIINEGSRLEEVVEKTFHVGSIEVNDEKIDFSMINSKGTSKADITLNSTLLTSKSIKLYIIPNDSFIKEGNLHFNQDIIVLPGKNEVGVKLNLDKKIFSKQIKFLENQDMKDKFKIVLKTSTNKLLSSILLPSSIVIGSWIDYNLEFIVILATFIILGGVFLYYVWKINQHSKIFGTLIMKKPKKRKTHLSSESWNLGSFKERRIIIGSSGYSKINVPFIKSESAILYSLGKVKEPSMWIRPLKNQDILVNNRVVTTDIRLNNGDDIEIDGYIFSWEK